MEDLERRNAELLDFAFTAAHDLRSPLMSISVAAQGLAQAAGVDLNDSAQTLLGHLLHKVAR